jgi:pimeloyl-ACP methyl ester carboxylesterase
VGSVEGWWAQGEHVPLVLSGAERQIFVIRAGAGAPLTLLHGFPSSSHDYARVVPALAADHALLLADFLGFGASEKPVEHTYSLHEQADLVEALWRYEGARSTALIAHDYAVSVAQELLARRAEGRLAVELESVLLLNGGLYPDLHRAQPTQLALLDPEQGPKLSALLGEELFVAGLAPTFAPGYAGAAADSAEMWVANSHEGGERIMHLLIRYMADRQAHAQRWTGALEATDVPLTFAWGMLDPVSGGHMAARVRERLAGATLHELPDVGHWPALEASGRVVEAARRS